MEAETGFYYMLTSQEMENIFNYLRNTVGWFYLSTGNYELCCICEIWKRYK